MGNNLIINGDYFSTAGGILVLVSNGSVWEEVTRSNAILQPYNAVPNGDFRGWTRPGTIAGQFTAPANNTQNADRWYWNFGGTGVVNVLQDTSLPAVAYNMPGAIYSAKINVTTADTSLAASDLYAYYTIIEGYDFQPLANGFAVSWWAKAHRTGTYCAAFINKAFNRNYIVEYNIAQADIWQYFTAVVPTPTGTWTYDSQLGMYCIFSLAVGSNFGSGSAANTWLTSGQYTTANQINGVAATSDTFSLWGLNVVPGTVPQPITLMPWALQQVRLQRYCQRLIAGNSGAYANSFSDGTNTAYAVIHLPTSMLGVPSTIFSPASTFWHYQLGGVFTPTAIVTAAAGTERIRCQMTGMSGLTNGAAGLFMDSGGGTSSILLESNPA